MNKDLIYREDVIEVIHNYWKTMVVTVPTKTTKYGIVYDTKQLDEILKHNKKLVELIKEIPSETEKTIVEVKVDTDEIIEGLTMKPETINPNNKKYFSDDFLEGFKYGVYRQYEADKAELQKHIRNKNER